MERNWRVRICLARWWLARRSGPRFIKAGRRVLYRRTGNLRAVQLLLGQAKIESTARDLGSEVEDALAISEKVDI